MSRLTVMRVIAWVMTASAIGFGVLTIVFGVVGPGQEVHAVHNAVVAALLIVLSAPPLTGIARAPGDALPQLVILAAVAVAGLATMAMSLTLDPFTLPFVLLIGVLWGLVPRREGAVPLGRPSPFMLALVIVAAGPLVTYALGQAELQRLDRTSEHAAFFHWVETSFYAIAIVLLGFLAALRPYPFRMAAWMGGLALAILGAASVVLGQHASALPAPWAWAALVGGAVFVAAGELEARRR